MFNLTFLYDTAAARNAVAPLESAVNDILERLKDISERAGDISDRLFTACGAAEGELEVLAYDVADERKDQCNSLEDQLLEIEIAARDLDELADFINKLTS
jgi:hypothetical protein